MQKQGSGPHPGKQEVQEGRQGLEGEESREIQVGLVELQKCAFPVVWEEEWEIRWCLGGEVGGQAGSGIRR